MIAALFAGQGGDRPRSRQHPYIDFVSDLIQLDARRLLERGGPHLFRTEVLQPLLVAVALADFEALAGDGPVEAVAGHSLGELAAWSAAGGLSAEQAMGLARARGLAMAEAARRHPGGMVALRSASRPQPPAGAVIAAHNTAETWILSGERAAIAGPGTPIGVAGPWHHPVMSEASAPFAEALAALVPQPLRCVFVSNRTAAPARADEIPALLLEQLVHPVLWAESMATLVRLGIQEVLLCGPSKELASWARSCAPQWSIRR